MFDIGSISNGRCNTSMLYSIYSILLNSKLGFEMRYGTEGRKGFDSLSVYERFLWPINPQTRSRKVIPPSKRKYYDDTIFEKSLRLYGFETLGALVAHFLTGKFPVITEDRKISSLVSKLRKKMYYRGHVR
jgi:hypothetical protein